MILVDTSIWIDHLRAAEPQLVALLTRNEVLAHPAVIGEVALGSISKRAEVLRYLNNLPAVTSATHAEVMIFIDRHKLQTTGIGYVDANLLASTVLTPGATLWSRNKNLRAAAARCGVGPKTPLN
ncbi:MAG TPA: type II toxin-antitoxin system VapC family toxin [Vitreimonas sp.]|uniref:type II toxin-antitoxin system VapC family toxin n=1 Tax=Vitreimonas sp. TaxID=3069702 RepID=UPI002D4DF3E3|nr:type II toxin-antitoxin system VapC family toxin [Vitreimonas sp.]HYD88838.1 type II toxin-antitoxin system VapC family toxin [Vitreimonas sp.]